MNQILDVSGQQWIRLFLRQWDIIFDCSAFGLIDCGQKFRIDHAINLIRIYQPKTVEVVLIGRNLHFNNLKQFLVKLKRELFDSKVFITSNCSYCSIIHNHTS